jgi:2-keto-4-pentenoate hydratase
MLGRKSYTREELDHAREAIDQDVAAYRALVEAVDRATTDRKVVAARDAFEARLFNGLLLVLDRYFVHRLRGVTGKDGNPINEVEVLAESLMNNGGVLRTGNVIKLVPEESVVKLRVGDRISLGQDDFVRLADAFFAEMEQRFLE